MLTRASLRLILLACLGLSLFRTQPAVAAAAFRLLPMNIILAPSGNGATQSFRVESIGDQPVAVQVRMVNREVALDGKETYPDADSDFLVYPPQILLKPGEEQTVRLTWLGDSKPTKELAYRVIAEQLPINLDPVEQNINGISVKIKALFSYFGSVYITPKNVASKIVLDSVVPQKSKTGADELAITFTNQGTAHAFLNQLNLHLTSVGQDGKTPQGTTVNLKPEQLKDINGENILAGNKRQFVIPWPASLPVGSVKATFDLERN